jgi:hypothetical protein
MSDITIHAPSTGAVEKLGSSLVQRAGAMVIDDEDSHAEALMLMQDLKRCRKRIVDEIFAKPKKLAHATWRAFCESERKLTGPCDKAHFQLDLKVQKYERRERERAEEEARQRQAEARKAEQEAALRDAVALEEAGELEAAEEILEAAEHAPEPVVEPEPQLAKVAGVHNTTRWSAEVTDLLQLVKFVSEHPEHLEAIKPNMTYLNQLARAQRSRMKVDGVRPVSITSKTVRA